MNIAYDHQIFGWQRYGGGSRYFFELASQLSVTPSNEITIVSPFYSSRYLRNRPPSLSVLGREVPYFAGSARIFRALNFILARASMKRLSPTIVHETYYSSRSVAPHSAIVVLTVFDMIHERFAHEFSMFNPTLREKASAVARADHIICISEATRRDLISLLDVAREKTSVVYLGAALTRLPEEDKFRSAEPFLLYVGVRNKYKNFSTLLKAYASSSLLSREFRIICFGGGQLTNDEARLMAKLGIREEQITQISGSDRTLATLYSGAAALIYPSLYEGFGIPTLEAMSIGCPVVCSSTSSLPEVVGDAAETFDPTSEGDMRNAIERVVSSPERSRELRALGCERAKLFSWRKCAEETLNIYRRLRAERDGDPK